MVRQVFSRLYRLLKGKELRIDPALPTSFILRKLFDYSILLLKHPFSCVFIHSGVTIINRKNVAIGKYSQIKSGVFIDGYCIEGIKIGKGVSIGDYTLVKCTSSFTEMGIGLSLGDGVGIGSFSYIGCGGGVSIGDNTIIGERLTIHSDNHNFHRDDILIKYQGVTLLPVNVGKNCWIGSNVSILGGVTIGDGSVIGAGSVVTRSIPGNSIAFGNPCKVRGKRLNEKNFN